MNATRGIFLSLLATACFTQCSVDDDGYRFGNGGRGGNSGGSTPGGTAGEGGMAGEGGTMGEGGSAGNAGTVGEGGSAGTVSEGGAPADGGTAGEGGTMGEGGSAGSGNGGATGPGGGDATAGGVAGAAGAGGAGGEAGVRTTGAGGKAPTGYCAGRSRPSGVVATDYDCFDLDTRQPSSDVWKSPRSNVPGCDVSGTTAVCASTVTATRAASAPNSWLVNLPVAVTSGFSQSTLARSFVGPTEITEFSVAANISLVAAVGVSAAWTGQVDVLCLDTGSDKTCLSYTEGGATDFAAKYTGLFVTQVLTTGSAPAKHCQVTGSITTGVWTRVELRGVRGTGATQVLLNDVNAAGSCSLSYPADSAADARVGLLGKSTVTRPFSAYYDNVEAYVKR